MGGDGGCHPNGRQYMQGTMECSKYEKEQRAEPDKREQALIRTRTCCLTNTPLEADTLVVADELGSLFAKEGLLKALVDKTLPPEFHHIRGLRDVIDCRFFPNPAPRPGRDDLVGLETWAPFSCPVAGVEMNGRHPFVVLRRTGIQQGDERVTALSEKAIKQVGLDALQEEYGPVTAEDIIKLVPGDEERKRMVTELDTRRALERAAKAEAKAAKASAKAEAKSNGKDKRKADQDSGEAQEGGNGVDERRAAKRAAKAAREAQRQAAAHHGASVGEARTAALTGIVKSEVAASLKAAEAQNPSLKALFHGAGSQKPESSQFQFICQAGKKMGGSCS